MPGSGKTTTLVTRLGYLIHCLGWSRAHPHRHLHRGRRRGHEAALCRPLWGGARRRAGPSRTINGICQSIISYYAWAKGAEPFALWTNGGGAERPGALADAVHGAEWPGEQEVKEVRTRITCCKNGMLRDEEVRAIEMDGWISRRSISATGSTWSATAAWTTTTRWSLPADSPPVSRHPGPLPEQIPLPLRGRGPGYLKIQHAILRLLAARSRNLFMVGTRIRASTASGRPGPRR